MASRTCESCGIKISPAEIQNDEALEFDGNYYCVDCKDEILPLIKRAKKSRPKKRRKKKRRKKTDAGDEKAVRKRKRRRRKKKRDDEETDGDDEARRKKRRRRRKKKAEADAGDDEERARKKRRRRKRRRAKEKAEAAEEEKETKKAAVARKKRRRKRKKAEEKDEEKTETGEKTEKKKARTDKEKKKAALKARKRKRKRKRPDAADKKKRRRRRDEEEDESSDGDEEERETAYPFEKDKRPVPVLPLAIVVACFILLAGIVVYLVSSSRAEDRRIAYQKAKKERRNERFDRILNRGKELLKKAEKGEVSWAVAEAFLFNARGVVKASEDHEDRLLALITDLRARLKKAGKEAFNQAKTKADRLLAEDKYMEAAKAYEEAFPPSARNGSWWKSARRELDHIEGLIQAKKEAEALLAKAKEYAEDGKLGYAKGVLLGYSDTHRGSIFFEQVKEKLAHYENELIRQHRIREERELAAAKAREERERRRRMKEAKERLLSKADSANWRELIGADLLNWMIAIGPDCFRLEDGVLRGDNTTGQTALRGAGSKKWESYIVEYKFKVVRGSHKLGVRAVMGKNQVSYTQLPVEGDGVSKGTWHSIRVMVIGTDEFGTLYECELDGRNKEIEPEGSEGQPHGGIAFVLQPSSEVHFKDVRVKVLEQRKRLHR